MEITPLRNRRLFPVIRGCPCSTNYRNLVDILSMLRSGCYLQIIYLHTYGLLQLILAFAVSYVYAVDLGIARSNHSSTLSDNSKCHSRFTLGQMPPNRLLCLRVHCNEHADNLRHTVRLTKANFAPSLRVTHRVQKIRNTHYLSVVVSFIRWSSSACKVSIKSER